MRIAIDIDGILTTDTYGHDYKNRLPNLGAIKLLNLLIRLVQEGIIIEPIEIFLYTARHPEDEEVTRKWLLDNGVLCNKIVFGKAKYNYLVDDLAL